MKYIFLIFFALVIAFTAKAGQPWFFGNNEAVNLTNGIAYQNGVKNIAGSLDPSSTAVNAPSGSMYYSTSGTIYVKQDSGLTTNWLPLGIASTGSLTTINGQSGPNVSIATGTSGTDFNITASSNTINLNIPSSSASNRGLLLAADWSTFNAKEPAITSGTTSQYWRGDKTFQTLDKNAVGLSNVDNTSDANKPVSTATQTALNLKEDTISTGTTGQYWRGDKTWQTLDKSAVGLSSVDNTSDANKPVSTAQQAAIDAVQASADGKITGVASSVDSEVVLFSGTTGKASKRATGSGYAKLTSGVLSTSATVATSDLTGQVALANGGTNKNMTAINGGVVYTDADSQEVTVAGTSGQILQSNGAAAPTWVAKSISGKAQNKTAVSVQEIQLPNNGLTLVTGNKYLAETGNKNILEDASFEGVNAAPSWTLTLGTFVADNSPIDGLVNAELSLSAQSLYFAQDSTLYASQFADGVQGLAMIRARTSITSTPIYVCPTQAGSVPSSLTSGCVQIQANGKWGLYKIPFILGGTSNGIAVTSNGVAISGSVELDDAFVGATDLKTDINVVGPWTTGTCTSSWTTTATVSCKYRQVGQDIEVSGALTANGAVTATSLSVSTPSGFTIDFSKIATAATNQIHSGLASFIDTPSGTLYQGRTLLIDSTNIQILSSNASATIVQPNGVSNTSPFTFGSGDIINFSYKAPVTQFSGASSVYTAQNADTDWQACGHTTSDFTGFGTVTNIETQCKREGSDLLMRGKFTVGTTTATEARVALKLNGAALTSTSNSTNGIPTIQAAGDLIRNVVTSSDLVTLIEPSVGYVTFGYRNDGSFAPLTKLNGSGMGSSGNVFAFSDVRIPISGWTNSNVIIGTFNEVMTTPGVTKPVLCSAKISSAGVISDQRGGCFASCTNATTPVCTFTSGFWVSGSVPNCWHSIDTGNFEGFKTTSSTTFQGVVLSAAGAAQAGSREYFCHGDRP